jgi:hypothetical protein
VSRSAKAPRTPGAADTQRQRWRVDLVADGKSVRRYVWMSNRGDADVQRWHWKVDTGLSGEGGGSPTLHWATREYDSAEQALADAQRAILHDGIPRSVILACVSVEWPQEARRG